MRNESREMTGNKLFYILGLIVFVMSAQWFIETMGEHHYEIQQATDIFDIAHKYLPDLHDYQWIINILPAALFVWILALSDGAMVLRDTLLMYLIVLMIRALTAATTILPKHEKCQVGAKFWNLFQGGGCYDKIFSGHMALVVLLLLNLASRGYLTQRSVWALGGVEALTILLTRGHYTVDVVLGTVIAYLVFDGDYSILKRFA